MKKTTRIIAALLVCVMLLGCVASAYGGDHLKIFEDIANMTPYTFSDVGINDWCYTGVKTCYDKGILLGYEDGSYKPETLVNWGHAITIAARLHAVYHGNRLDTTVKSGSYWYQPYYDYCAQYGLIPSTCPRNTNLSSVVIPRNALAYIFSRTIDKDDMPEISDRPISDLSSIPAVYQDSVKTMYAAGILTGYDDNSFRGNNPTKRSHVAVVVSRLLQPANRIGHDGRINEAMAPFQSNLENDSIAVKYGKYTYCLSKYYESTTDERYALYRTDGSDKSQMVYECKNGEYLSNISLYNGYIYFCKNNVGAASGALMRCDPSTGRVTSVYIGSGVESYCFYNGEVYALLMTKYALTLDSYEYIFGKIGGNNLEALSGPFSYDEASKFCPYGWNGRIFFKLVSPEGKTNLYAYDIAKHETAKISDLDINTSFFEGHVMYFLVYDAQGNLDPNLYAISLEMPDVVRTIGAFPSASTVNNRSLYKHGDLYYCLSSNNRNVYTMDEAGRTRLALMCGGVYNAMCFTDDMAFTIPTNLATCNVNEIKASAAKTLSATSVYGDWLGIGCYYEGAHFVADKGRSVFTSTESVSSMSKLDITVPSAFSRGSDFVVQTQYTNVSEDTVRLRMYIVKLYLGDDLVGYDINRMVSMTMKPGGVHTYTFIVGGTSALNGVDLNDGRFSIEIIPTFDVVNDKK